MLQSKLNGIPMSKFTPHQSNALQNYVYALVDPATKAPFYIGRGIGNRAFSHLSADGETAKATRINEIRAAGREPVVEILRFGLALESAKLVEATLIDTLRPTLVNQVRGADVQHGMISAADFQRKFGGRSVKVSSIKEPTMLIFVNKTWNADNSEVEIYDSIRQFWSGVSKATRTPRPIVGASTEEEVMRLPYPVALGVVGSVVMRAYSVAAWFTAGTTFSTRLDATNPDLDGGNKFEFVGQIIPNHKLLGVRLTDDAGESIKHLQKGYAYLPTRT